LIRHATKRQSEVTAVDPDDSSLFSAENAPSPPLEIGDDGPAPVQFSLKSLFVITTLLCAAFAVVARLSLLGAVAMVWMLVLLAAHVSGNAWGSRATARATRSSRFGLPPGGEFAAEPLTYAPQTHLGSQASLGLRTAMVVGVGAAVGSVVGLALIWRHNRGGLGPTGMVLGAFSSAVIGAFLTFLASSFLKIFAKAFRQAADSAGKQGNAPAEPGA
jgi:hypothetical protein